jgi:GNAT superfamily N-acetyltransferase
MWEDIDDFVKSDLDRGDPEYRTWARARLRNGTLQGWLAEDAEGRVVGSGCIWLEPVQPPLPWVKERRLPYLMSMFTEPSYRGKGVASAIVKAAVEWSRVNGFPSVRLHASEMGQGVYERLGFERVVWLMRLKLK